MLGRMTFTDRYGLPLTTTSAEAAQRYAGFLDRNLAAAGGANAALQQALAADPDFALAHAAQAFLHGSAGNLTAARESAARATALAAGATPREQSAIATVAALVAGEGPRAVSLLQQHLEQYPRDIVAVQQATLAIGAGAAGSADPRRARLDLLEHLADAFGDDWAFLTMYGFALNEVGRHDLARENVERALASNPRSGTAAHAYAHVFYQTGEPAAGAAFLAEWLPGYPPDANFFVHNHWHFAVFELQLGHFEQAMAVYRTGVSPETERSGPAVLIGGGAAALLWRAVLSGHSADALPWGPVRDYFDRVGSRFGGAFRALWDSYAAVTYAAAGDEVGYHTLQEQLAASPAANEVVLGSVRKG